jgi:WD40 repeat protein
MHHQAHLHPAFVRGNSQHRITTLLRGALFRALSSISLSISLSVLLGVLFIPLLWTTSRAQAPELSLFDINTSNFPTITARFLAIDGTGNQLGNFTANQLLIQESQVFGRNVQRRILSIEGCPPRSIGTMNREVSLALSFDISGSMRRTIPTPTGALTYNDAAVQLGRRLVSDLGSTDEAAVQVCNDRPLIRSPFVATDDVGKQRTVQAFPPSAAGDNEFVRHLYEGGSSLHGLAASASKPNKVAVLFTDAFWHAFTPPQLQTAIAAYTGAGIRFFAVLIGPRLENVVPNEREPIAKSLRALAAATGGRVFENVQSPSDVDGVLISLQRLIRSDILYTPCTISWLSEQTCETNPVRVDLTSTDIRLAGAVGVANYSIPNTRIQRVVVTGAPEFRGFSGNQTITLRASSGELRNIRISPVPNAGVRPEVFSVEPSMIAVLRPGESVPVRVNFNPTGGSSADFQSALFRVEADGAACESFLSARNFFGPPVVQPAPAPPTPSGMARTPRSVIAFRPTITPSLRLTHPNGREVFQVGSDTIVTWTGIAANDVVTLDYSIDRGRTWTILSTTATGLRHAWQNVPAPPSDSCLMRVTQTLPSTSGTRSEPKPTINHGPDGGFVTGAMFDPTSIYVVTAGRGGRGTGTSVVWDSFDGNPLTQENLSSPSNDINLATWSVFGPVGLKLSGDGDGNLTLWQNGSDQRNGISQKHAGRVNHIAMTRNSRLDRFLTASADGTARLYQLQGTPTATTARVVYTVAQTFSGHQQSVNAVAFGGRNEELTATASSDGWVKIWDTGTARLWDSIPRGARNGAAYRFVAFHPTNDDLVAVAHGTVAEVWNWRLGRLVKTFRGHRGQVNTVSFNPSGTALVTASSDRTAKLWDSSGVELATLSAHRQEVNSAMFSPDGTAIVTASNDGTAIVWTSESIGVAGVLQSDVSDTLWRIVQPRAVAVDVVMDTVAVGLGRDKIVTGVIRNTGSVPITLTGLQFRGTQAAEFRLPGGGALGTLVLAPGASQTLELTFAPRGTGERQAQMLIFSHRDTIKTLTGAIPTIRGWGEELLVRAFDTVFADTPVGAVATIRGARLIRNVGSIPVTIDSVRIDGPDVRPVFDLPTNPIPAIAPGNAPSFDIAFAPARVGPANTVVVFYFRRPSGARDSVLSYIYGRGLESLTRLVGTAPEVQLTCVTTTTSSLQLRNSGAGRIINVQLADVRPANERIVQVVNAGAVPREFSAQSTATIALSVNMAANPLATSDSLRFLYRVAADVTDSVLIVRVPLRYTARQMSFSQTQVTLQTFTANQPVRETVQVLNTGTEPLDWASVLRLPLLLAGSTTSSVGNRTGSIVLDSIVPAITPVGGRSTLFVRFTGSALGTEIAGTFSPQMLGFTDLCSPQVLTVRATTVPPYPFVVVTTGSAVVRCETETQVPIRAELRNAGAAVLTVDSVRLVGRDASEFTIVDAVRGNFEAVGGASNAQIFFIRWRPGQPGEKDVRLQVFSNAQNPPRNFSAPNRSVPIEIPFSAFKHRVAFTIAQTSPQLTDTPLGVQQEGRFLLTNTGTLPLTFPPDGVVSLRGAVVSIAIRPARLLPAQAATITLRGSFPAPAEEYVVGYSLTEDTCGVTLPLQWRVRTLTRGSRLELNGGRSVADTLVVRCETGTSSVHIPLVNVGRGVIDGMGSAALRVRTLSQASQALLPPSFSFWYNNRPFTAANFPNGISIAAGERDSLELRFTPVGAPPYRTVAPITLDVQHDYPPSSVPLSIVGRVETSGLQFSAASLQFVNYPNQPPQPLRITNTGSLPIENFAVRFSRLGNVFQTMTEMPSGSTFAGGTTRTVNVRFAAVANFAGQVVRDTALVVDACGTVTRIPLVAVPPSATVQMQSAQARPGDTVQMPLLLTERVFVPVGVNIPLVLSYNASLLLPMLTSGIASAPMGNVAGGVRTLRLDNVSVPSQDETQPLTVLTFRAALGNAPATALQLSTDATLTAWITLNVTSGTVFALRGLSHADGTRLVNATTAVFSNITVQPVPAQSQDNVVTVEYESSQASPVTVMLTTLFGEAISPQPPMSFDPPAQAVVGRKNSVAIDVRSLPAGVYFVNIRSPLQVVSRRLVIIR